MSLIATCVEQSGVARIFDLRPAERSPEEERRIEMAIERASELAATESETVGNIPTT